MEIVINNLTLKLKDDEGSLINKIKIALNSYSNRPFTYKIMKKAIDARKKNDILFVYSCLVNIDGDVDITKIKGAKLVDFVEEMDISDGIKIPGPEKPIINDPIPTENLSVGEDHTAHVIVDDSGVVTLPVYAVAGETNKTVEEVGENPVVSLTYDWKRKIDNISQSVDGSVIAPNSMQVYLLGSAGHGNIPADSNEDDATYNQTHLSLAQIGSDIYVYATDNLKTYPSTNPTQGEGQWIGFDIDTGLSTIIGSTWGSDYILNQSDVDEAASVGLGAGHIVFWAKAENLAEGREISIDENTLTVHFSNRVPSELSYSFNADKSAITISGLSDANLDEHYYVDVTAQRNGIRTTESSGEYRLTKAPEIPVITVYDKGQRKEMNYKTATDPIVVYRRRNGILNKISFSVTPIKHSDSISYVWMRVNFDANELEDWEDNRTELQIDLDDALADLFEDKPGEADYPVNGVFGLTQLNDLGEVVNAEEENGPVLNFTNDMPTGYYYCIVINELNGHRKANVTPFYELRENVSNN